MEWELVWRHADLLAYGVWVTITLTALALGFGFLIATPLALVRAARTPILDPLVRAYVYVFRGTPLIIQAYLIYYGLSQFEGVRESIFWPVLREAWWCALIAFTLNTAAYQTELLRGAIETLPKGAIEGARALGLSAYAVARNITVPLAFRKALPAYSNEVVFMLHGSAVASILTVQDILGAGRTINAKYYVAYEGFLAAAALYMVVTFGVARVMRMLETRMLAYQARA